MDKLAYTVAEFCRLHCIGRTQYYKLAAAGLGPREMRVGRKPLISVEAAREWREARERDALGAAVAPGTHGIPGGSPLETVTNRA